MPVDSGKIYMHLHMTTMEQDARQGGAMALYGPKVAPPLPTMVKEMENKRRKGNKTNRVIR